MQRRRLVPKLFRRTFYFSGIRWRTANKNVPKKNSWIGGVLENYDTFIANFQKMLYYVQNAFTSESFQILIEDYLSCAEGYSDFKFFERYGYVLIVCGIATFSDTSMKKEVVKYNNSVFFSLLMMMVPYIVFMAAL